MKCYNCTKPAMYLVGDQKIPLCLDCNLKLMQLTQTQNEILERQINYLSDQMDDMVGLPHRGPRFPERKNVNVGKITQHNISLNNSTVGVLNTGNIGTIETALSVINKAGDEKLANALYALAEGILKNNQIQLETKNQLLEILSVLSTEATTNPDQRHTTVVSALITRFREMASLTADLSTLWAQWGPTIESLIK